MSCETPLRPGDPAVSWPTSLLLALFALFPVACGKKGDPLPPLSNVPMTTSDLTISQQGREMLFSFGFPKTTISGLTLGGIDSVELIELVKPLLADGELPRVENLEFIAGSKPVLTLRGSELTAAVTGDRIQFRVPMAAELPDPPVASFFAVRTYKGEETSSFSNRVALTVAEPPAAPKDLQLDSRADGITLSWSAEEAEELEGFDIFRRDARNRGYDEAIGSVDSDETTFSDTTARFGNRYIYTVKTVASRDPFVSSAAAGEREIEYEDRFPPPLPKNFVALAEPGRVRLRWDPSAAGDIAGYIVLRREPGRDFHPITPEPISGLEFVSEGLTPGFSYSFRIQVVDQKGNRSALSEPVTTTAR